MTKGTRVKLSKEGESLHPKSHTRVGTIVGESREPGCVRVKWDHNKGAETYSKFFLTEIRTP